MKRRILALIGIVMILALTACAAAPGADAADLVYDMTEYNYFVDIFEAKAPEEWESMGAYTVLLEGLDTPVTVHMDGTDVLSIDAFGQSAELGESGLANEYHDGYSPVDIIRSTKGAVVIRASRGEYSVDSIVITRDGCHTFRPENGYRTAVFVGDDGALEYCRIWDRMNDIDQMGVFETLAICTSRDEPLYEMGRVEIKGDDPVLTVEETVVFSEMYDLDALFAKGKEAGAYEAYETLDDLLAANGS